MSLVLRIKIVKLNLTLDQHGSKKVAVGIEVLGQETEAMDELSALAGEELKMTLATTQLRLWPRGAESAAVDRATGEIRRE